MGAAFIYRLTNSVIESFIEESAATIAGCGARVATVSGKRYGDDLFVTLESFAKIAKAVGETPARILEVLSINQKLVFGHSAGAYTYIAEIGPDETTGKAGRLTGYRIKGVYSGPSILVYSDEARAAAAPAKAGQLPGELVARVSVLAAVRTPISAIARQLSMTFAEAAEALVVAGFARPSIRLASVNADVLRAMEAVGVLPSVWCSYYGVDPNDIDRAMTQEAASPRACEAAAFLSCDFGLSPRSLAGGVRTASHDLEDAIRQGLQNGVSIFSLALETRAQVRELYTVAASLQLISKKSSRAADLIVPSKMHFVLKSAHLSVDEWADWYGLNPRDVARVANGNYDSSSDADVAVMRILAADFPGALKRIAHAYSKLSRRPAGQPEPSLPVPAAGAAGQPTCRPASEPSVPVGEEPSIRTKVLEGFAPGVPLREFAARAGCTYAYAFNILVQERRMPLCTNSQKGLRYQLMAVWPELRAAMRDRRVSLGQYAAFYGLDAGHFDQKAAAAVPDAEGLRYIDGLLGDFPEIAGSRPTPGGEEPLRPAEGVGVTSCVYGASNGESFTCCFEEGGGIVTALVDRHRIIRSTASTRDEAYRLLCAKIEHLISLR